MQILAYVREMETKDVPNSADTTVLHQAKSLTKESEENARNKEIEYNKRAIDQYQEELRRQPNQRAS